MPRHCFAWSPIRTPTRCRTSNTLGVYVEAACVNQGPGDQNPWPKNVMRIDSVEAIFLQSLLLPK